MAKHAVSCRLLLAHLLAVGGACTDPTRDLGPVPSSTPSLAPSPPQYQHPLMRLATRLRSLQVVEEQDTAALPPIQLHTNCSTFTRPGQICNVSWEGVLFPAQGDLVALYVPAHADPRLSVPIQFAHAAAASAEHLTSGRGWAV